MSVRAMLRLHDFAFSIRCKKKKKGAIFTCIFSAFTTVFRQVWECDTQEKLPERYIFFLQSYSSIFSVLCRFNCITEMHVFVNLGIKKDVVE